MIILSPNMPFESKLRERLLILKEERDAGILPISVYEQLCTQLIAEYGDSAYQHDDAKGQPSGPKQLLEQSASAADGDGRKNNRGALHRKSYTKELKMSAIIMRDAGGPKASFEAIALKLGVPKVNVEKWCSLKGRERILTQMSKYKSTMPLTTTGTLVHDTDSQEEKSSPVRRGGVASSSSSAVRSDFIPTLVGVASSSGSALRSDFIPTLVGDDSVGLVGGSGAAIHDAVSNCESSRAIDIDTGTQALMKLSRSTGGAKDSDAFSNLRHSSVVAEATDRKRKASSIEIDAHTSYKPKVGAIWNLSPERGLEAVSMRHSGLGASDIRMTISDAMLRSWPEPDSASLAAASSSSSAAASDTTRVSGPVVMTMNVMQQTTRPVLGNTKLLRQIKALGQQKQLRTLRRAPVGGDSADPVAVPTATLRSHSNTKLISTGDAIDNFGGGGVMLGGNSTLAVKNRVAAGSGGIAAARRGAMLSAIAAAAAEGSGEDDDEEDERMLRLLGE